MRVRSLKKSQDKELINNFIKRTKKFLSKASNQKFYNQKFSFRVLLSSILLKLILKPFCAYLKIIQTLSNDNSKLNLFIFSFRFLFSIFKRLSIKKEYRKKYKKYKLSKTQKRKNLRIHGMQILVELKKIFDEIDIINFADFGTLLGLVREKKILRHDLDLDYGIINNGFDIDAVNIKLERTGFKLWRNYKYNKVIVQSSYYYKGIKIDISIYNLENNILKTWLFYKAPKIKYKNHERNIVEVSINPIKGIKSTLFNKRLINIPIDPESVLTQKYGKDWQTPKKNWIYWDTPCSKPLDSIGYYFEYN